MNMSLATFKILSPPRDANFSNSALPMYVNVHIVRNFIYNFCISVLIYFMSIVPTT